MQTNNEEGVMSPENEEFSERDSLDVIRKMIQVSQSKLRNDGILFIVWGWMMFLNYLSHYVNTFWVKTYYLQKAFSVGGWILFAACVGFTLHYLFRQRSQVSTYIGMSLRYIWFGLIFSMMLANLILFNTLHEFRPEVQHPIFMLLIAFAIMTTGAIMRYWLLVAGAMCFALLAWVSSLLSLPHQLLAESIAWLVAFVVPGHIMYARRKV